MEACISKGGGGKREREKEGEERRGDGRALVSKCGPKECKRMLQDFEPGDW